MAEIKILATSDLHGNLPEIKGDFDLMFICGDVCPSTYYGSKAFQEQWLRREFTEWVRSIATPRNKIVMIPGNHDFYLEGVQPFSINELEAGCDYRLKVLRHQQYIYGHETEDGNIQTIKIFGTPYCRVFGTWAFMYSDNYLTNAYYSIPEDTDILISHDAPNIYGLGDITEGRYQQKGTGSPILAEAIYRIKPSIFHCGHFHSGNHNFEEHDGIWMANVSLVNERYLPVNKVLEYQFDITTKTVIYDGENN